MDNKQTTTVQNLKAAIDYNANELTTWKPNEDGSFTLVNNTVEINQPPTPREAILGGIIVK